MKPSLKRQNQNYFINGTFSMWFGSRSRKLRVQLQSTHVALATTTNYLLHSIKEVHYSLNFIKYYSRLCSKAIHVKHF